MWWPRLGALRFVDMYAGVICTLDRHGRVTRKATGSSIAAFLNYSLLAFAGSGISNSSVLPRTRPESS